MPLSQADWMRTSPGLDTVDLVVSRSGCVVVRVYEDPGRHPGEHRVLVDRLWPRGVKKAALDADGWVKDAAPSTALRRWYGHVPGRFSEFARRYRAELAADPGAAEVSNLREIAKAKRVVLLTATRDVEHSGAAVLQEVINQAE